MTSAERCRAAVGRLAKWRAVFAGWQVGTMVKGDPVGDAVRDHRELSLILRAEVSAIAGLLIGNGTITGDEFLDAVAAEADRMSKDLSDRFPGIRATDDGIAYDARAVDTMKGWLP